MTHAQSITHIERPTARELGNTALDFLHHLAGPTIIVIPGRDRSRCRGLATLLHGNEPSGVRALHRWLHKAIEPVTDVICFLGAVEAATTGPEYCHRMLPNRRDLNRCFGNFPDDQDGDIAREATEALLSRSPECIVDLHNNSGHNPAYGVITATEEIHLRLVSLFSQQAVLSDLNLGALTEHLNRQIPTITVECGRSQSPDADETAYRGLERLFESEAIEACTDPTGVRVFRNPIRVLIKHTVHVAFDTERHPRADLTLNSEIDRFNFSGVAAGTVIGWAEDDVWPFEARGGDGEDVSRTFFEVVDGTVRTRVAITPIMMTTNEWIATTDCLCYLVTGPDEA